MGAKQTHISLREFAERYGISIRTAHRWAVQRTIPTVKLGHVRRVVVAGLEELDRSACAVSSGTPIKMETIQ